MKNSLSNADLAIWLAMIAGKVILCLCLFRKNEALEKNAVKRLPCFSAYIFVSTVASLLTFILAFLASYEVYYYVFHAAGYVKSTAALLTLIEFALYVFPYEDSPQSSSFWFKWPHFNLPGQEKAVGWLLLALAGIAVFVAQWQLRYVEKRFDVAANLLVAAVFIFIALYARDLHLGWSRLMRGVSFTFGAQYLVDGIAKALINHYSLVVGLQIRLFSEGASLLAIVAWIIVILSPWGEYKLTQQGLATLQKVMGKIEDDMDTLMSSASQLLAKKIDPKEAK